MQIQPGQRRSLATRGIAHQTLLTYARYCLAVAHVVQSTSRDRVFTTAEIEVLARTWAAGRVRRRRAAGPRWPQQHFRAIATAFLHWLGRWTPPPPTEGFLAYLTQTNGTLATVTPEQLDAYFKHVAPRWSRVSLRSAALALRIWFRHCEARGWVRPGLAAAILVPRIYREESLPIGPTWDTVNR